MEGAEESSGMENTSSMPLSKDSQDGDLQNLNQEEKDVDKEVAETAKRAKGEKPIDEEKLAEIERNPDLEDPRLYSPLQEPDRPHPSERTSEPEQPPCEQRPREQTGEEKPAQTTE